VIQHNYLFQPMLRCLISSNSLIFAVSLDSSALWVAISCFVISSATYPSVDPVKSTDRMVRVKLIRITQPAFHDRPQSNSGVVGVSCNSEFSYQSRFRHHHVPACNPVGRVVWIFLLNFNWTFVWSFFHGSTDVRKYCTTIMWYISKNISP
jgi:hypothetical protein